MQYVNLTPHVIRFRETDGTLTVFEPSGQVARVEQVVLPVANVDGRKAVQLRPGVIQGLPDPQAQTIYIVSGMVLTSVSADRFDIVAPGTAPGLAPERHPSKGFIIAVTAWSVAF